MSEEWNEFNRRVAVWQLAGDAERLKLIEWNHDSLPKRGAAIERALVGSFL
jgi:hypothetical protein